MANWSVQHVLTAPGPLVVTFNAGSGDEFYIDPSQSHGLDGAGRRASVDDAPQTHGGIVFPTLKTARHFMPVGILLNRTGTATARNTMEDALFAALEAIDGADGTWVWTPTGGSARSLTVRQEIPVEFTSIPGYPMLKAFSFGLVAADPDW